MNWMLWVFLGVMLALAVWSSAYSMGPYGVDTKYGGGPVVYYPRVFLFAVVKATPTPLPLAVPAWFTNSFNASNYSDVILPRISVKYSANGTGYISAMDGWASWGLNDTTTRVWTLSQNASLRCIKRPLGPGSPEDLIGYWDYSNECN
jgi:hypothetical protein